MITRQKKMKLLIPLVLLSLLAGRAHSTSLSVAFNEWPPWKMFDQDSYAIGIDAEILKELGKRINTQLSFLPCPWVRCLVSLENGSIDVLTSVIRNKERESYLHYLEPSYINESKTVFYIKKGAATRVNQYDDLKKYTIGVIRGYKYFNKFDSDSTLSKEILSYDFQGFMMLQLGRLDTFVSPEISGDYIISTKGMESQFDKSELTFESNIPLYITLSKKSKMTYLLPALEREIRGMVNDGTVSKIIREVTSGIRP
jgi:polar amino acid transport system substrate-binding protein